MRSVRPHRRRHWSGIGRWRLVDPAARKVHVRIRIVAFAKKIGKAFASRRAGVTPDELAVQPVWMMRPHLGKPILLLAIVCAFLMPLSNPVANRALADSTFAAHFQGSVDSLLDRQFIQQQIVHIATHPKVGVPFLTAFLTEAERLCQPNARPNPDIPSPNASSPLLNGASSIALPAVLMVPRRPSRMLIGMESPSRVDGMSSPPDFPPPRAVGFAY